MDSIFADRVDLMALAQSLPSLPSDVKADVPNDISIQQPQPTPPKEGWHAEPQVNWLLATSPKKVNWLRSHGLEQNARLEAKPSK